MGLKATRRLYALMVGSMLIAVMPAAMALSLRSPAFSNGQAIPSRYTCDGAGVSPALIVADVPDGTQSLALLVEDPDAPGGIWIHWVVYDLPPETGQLASTRTSDDLPPGTVTSENSFGHTRYGGMCPPSGQQHRYIFSLFALDTRLADDLHSAAAVRAGMQGHVLAAAKLIGHYRRRE
ncbi:MAG: YbhB/YbcL family Raf kinase inhibitor-like protein [Salinisphaera sp.]|jgi:Raf kinase inhibitor-like YbhB/YbcL family protein|nr:YbhB/YbcL family Raf kinase inhibitor-like protein [Salinisphaera sp.]